MVRILAVIGSPRKGNTYRVTQLIEEEMKMHGEVEFDYLFLKDSNLQYCTGCGSCFKKGEEYCPLRNDGRAEIETKMAEADGVILACPVYALSVSALMKNFFDRFAYVIHRPRFFGKYALIVSTTGAAFLKDTMKLMENNADLWGFNVVDKYGVIYHEDPLPEKEQVRVKKSAKRFYEAVSEKELFTPRLFSYLVFNLQRSFFRVPHADFTRDHEYFKENGWLNPDAYYFTENIEHSRIKSAAGRIIAKIAGS